MASLEQLRISEITESHLRELVTMQIAEGDRTLEFKQDLKVVSNSEKREFCTDVVSFANAVGGLQLHGISANNGVAVEVFGIETQDADGLVLQVTQILHSGISPRLPWIDIRAIPLKNGRFVLAIKMLRSAIAPYPSDAHPYRPM